MANEVKYQTSSSTDFYFSKDGVTDGTGYILIGWDGVDSVTRSGALRFPSIPIGQGVSVNDAQLRIYVGNRTGTNPILAKFYGIKETNTSAFGAGVNGRTRTTATNTNSYTPTGSGGWFQTSVTSIVNEILAQGGWSSGNAMGFYVDDNGTSTAHDCILSDTQGSADDSLLFIRVSAEPNFTPTPVTVSAPTFPAHDRFGIKISKPGVNVLTATDDELYFTTWKDVFKVNAENTASCTANTVKTIAHGLGYVPQVLAYCRAGGYSVKLPRFPLSTDPITGGARGYAYADATNIYFLIDQTADVYYYVFTDEQAT